MSGRRHDIDGLRVVGTALVFVFHCLQPFNAGESWHIENGVKSAAVAAVIVFLNIWIMPLFMLLAGASARYALGRRTTVRYVQERSMRILLPLVAGMVLIVPPQVYLERRLRGQFAGSFLDYVPHAFEGVYPAGNLSWHHLWFLAYLFVYSLAALPLFRWLDRPAARAGLARIAAVVERPGGFLLPAVPLIVAHASLAWRFPQTNALLNDWAWHAQLFGVFVLGYMLVAEERLGAAIERAWRPALGVAVAATAGVFALRGAPAPAEVPEIAWRILKAAAYRGATWCWVVTALGLGRRWLGAGSTAMARAAAGSYPFYVLHQTVIVTAAFFVVQMPLALGAKLALLAGTALAGTWAAYELLRRFSVTALVIGAHAPKGSSRAR